jgi:myo-inositol-1(or 4)-monophosphatase
MWEGDVWVAIRAARSGAAIVAAGFHRLLETEMKGEVDPVTATDRDAEDAIRAVIASYFPQDGILGEEGGGPDWEDGRVWIIDPLDGTVNFVRGIPQVAVSVALWNQGRPLVGIIIDVARNEEFVAGVGEGATVNGRQIKVSETATMEDSLLATGFPYDRRQHAGAYLRVVEAVMARSRGTRRMGAAALDLAWVACGRFDGYWEHGGSHGVKPWDLAAGVLLVTEAGGTVTDHLGRPDRLRTPVVVATNGKIHEDLRAIVAETMPQHLL